MRWPPEQGRTLEGRVVKLEPISPDHRDPLLAAAAAPATWRWLDRTMPGDEAGFDRWFAERSEASTAGREWCFVTVSAASGRPIGSSSYLTVRPEHDGLEIGWTWLNPEAWGSGANVEAKLLMLEHAFESLGCMRVEFKTDARNERARAALAALPARFEGIFRKHMLMPGIGVRDSAFFSITDDDWPEVRRALEARLAAKAGITADA
jgi:RimJ/RimL family protein N-acetyltransferase